MKPRHQRLLLVAASLALLGAAGWMVLTAFSANMVFFHTPSEVQAGKAPRTGEFRIGGLVERNSVKRTGDGLGVEFVVTDHAARIAVHYRGALPDLFRENKGVVAQGAFAGNGRFVASQVLAKHDENYMPPDAGYALEQAKAVKR